MFAIIGKTASGKDTLVRELCKKHGFTRVISYNTRPMREGEENGVTYHFISPEEFAEKRETGFFIECEPYLSEGGTQWHGFSRADVEGADTEKSVVILTPSGLRKLRSLTDAPIRCIYLYANNATIRERLKKRGDKKDEAERRLLSDNKEFSGAELIADRILYNNGGRAIADIADQAAELFAGWVDIGKK